MNKRVQLLNHLTSGWPGEPVSPDGRVRILNRHGTRPPLLWCFNGQAEFPAMAEGLGPDQPLIGMRSLHLVEPMGPTRYRMDEITGDDYAHALLTCPWLDLERCVVGGNCQGAGIAFRIAANLLAASKSVDAVISMEAQPVLPLPCRVGFIFGAQSEMFNPFLRGESPEARWRTLFGEPIVEIIPGTHGEYFTQEKLPSLCAAISRIIDFSAQGRAADRQSAGMNPTQGALTQAIPTQVHLRLVNPPESCPRGEEISIEIEAAVTMCPDTYDTGSIGLHCLWTSAEHGIHGGEEVQVLAPRTGRWSEVLTAKVIAPPDPGLWDLQFFVCEENAGPVSWLNNQNVKCLMQIEF